MPTLRFTPQLRRFTATPEVKSETLDLRALLDEAFAQNPALRGYVLDEQGGVRANIALFVDGLRRSDLNVSLKADSEVYVLQALSGG